MLANHTPTPLVTSPLSDAALVFDVRHWNHKASEQVAAGDFDGADESMGFANAALAELMTRWGGRRAA